MIVYSKQIIYKTRQVAKKRLKSMWIPIIRRTKKLPKLKKKLSSRKLMASFREALSNFVISPSTSKFIITAVNCLPALKQINQFTHQVFSLMYKIFALRGENS